MPKFHIVFATIDTTPAMTAQDLASAQVMLRELVSELTAVSQRGGNGVLLSLIYCTEDGWKVTVPDRVENIREVPELKLISPKRAEHFHRAVTYMCFRLLESSGIQEWTLAEDVKLMYFGSGRLPGSAFELRQFFPKAKWPAVLNDSRCQRYLLCTGKPDDKTLAPVWEYFADAPEHIITADGFSELLGNISMEFTPFQSFF